MKLVEKPPFSFCIPFVYQIFIEYRSFDKDFSFLATCEACNTPVIDENHIEVEGDFDLKKTADSVTLRKFDGDDEIVKTVKLLLSEHAAEPTTRRDIFGRAPLLASSLPGSLT